MHRRGAVNRKQLMAHSRRATRPLSAVSAAAEEPVRRTVAGRVSVASVSPRLLTARLLNILCGLLPLVHKLQFLPLLQLQVVLELGAAVAGALSPDGLVLLEWKSRHLVINSSSDPLASWNKSDDSPCKWQGVECYQDDLSVSIISLDFSTMEGNLSSRLFSLPNLTTVEMQGCRGALNIDHCGLSGAIPHEIVHAKLLMELRIVENKLSGNIPDIISQLRKLISLDFSHNLLSGPVPNLDGLANLRALSLTGNRLSGPLPVSLSSLHRLEELLMGGNNLSGTIPSSLGGLTNLARLDLSDNRLSGCFPDLASGQLERLGELDLSSSTLGGSVRRIACLPNLYFLNLSHNNFSGHIADIVWASHHSLRSVTVDLSDNNFTGSIPGQLMQQFFTPNSTYSIRGYGPYLNLSRNQLSGTLPDVDVLHLVEDSALHFHGYHTVDLSCNQLEGPIPSSWRGGIVHNLLLHSNKLTGDISSSWSLSATGSISWGIYRLELHYRLQLQGNNLTGQIGPSTCANWTSIGTLDLSGNPVSLVGDSLSVMLDTFKGLTDLRLSNIASSGKLPTHALNRTRELLLMHLDLSNSNLHGDLSQSIMGDAHYLFKNLTFLDLSGNQLTGQVPISFTIMPNLRLLNLSHNDLSGRLPPLPPHLLNKALFAGNPKLCGPPLEECHRSLWYHTVVFKLGLTLICCVLVSFGGLVFFVRRHRQDADLIAALQEKDNVNLMRLADLRKATSNFSEQAQIGVGGFGTVYKGRLQDGTEVAIKKSKRQRSQRDKDQFLNEVRILSQMNHRNLVRLLGCCLENKTALLVFEFVPGGTLQERLRPGAADQQEAAAAGPSALAAPPAHSATLTWEQRLSIALDTAHALAHLHSYSNPPIFHRDVKSANILLDQDMKAKVADFGISKLVPVDATHVTTAAVQGTFGYMDPEYYGSSQFSAKSDVYSFGVVLLELISGLAPVDLAGRGRVSEYPGLTLFAVPLIKKGDFEELIDPVIAETFESPDTATGRDSIVAVASLAVKCLKSRSKDRPTMKQVNEELQALWHIFHPAEDSYDDDSNQLLDLEEISRLQATFVTSY